MLRTESLRASEIHTPKESLCQNKKSSGMFKNNPEQISQKDTEKKHFSCVHPSSFIQTVLSASEFHRIMPYGSWAVPPVGNRTLPWRFLIQLQRHYSTASFGLQGHSANRDETGMKMVWGWEWNFLAVVALSRGLAASGPLFFCQSFSRLFLQAAESDIFSKLFVDTARFLW